MGMVHNLILLKLVLEHLRVVEVKAFPNNLSIKVSGCEGASEVFAAILLRFVFEMEFGGWHYRVCNNFSEVC